MSPGGLGSTVTASTPKESRPSVCTLEARLWTILLGSLAAQKVGSRGQAQPEGDREDTSARLTLGVTSVMSRDSYERLAEISGEGEGCGHGWDSNRMTCFLQLNLTS